MTQVEQQEHGSYDRLADSEQANGMLGATALLYARDTLAHLRMMRGAHATTMAAKEISRVR